MNNQQPPWLNQQGQPVPQPHPFNTVQPESTNAINPKVGKSAFAGAVTAVLLWVASYYGMDIPAYIGGQITLIVMALTGWIVKD